MNRDTKPIHLEDETWVDYIWVHAFDREEPAEVHDFTDSKYKILECYYQDEVTFLLKTNEVDRVSISIPFIHYYEE